jgi:hypothetical protein
MKRTTVGSMIGMRVNRVAVEGRIVWNGGRHLMLGALEKS